MPSGQKKANSKARPKKPEGAKNTAPLLPASIRPDPDRHGLEKYRDEFADQAAYMCSLGATDNELANWFGVGVGTLHSWRFRYPKFSEALKSGKSAADDRVERSLYMNAVGYSYEAEKPIVVKDADGNERVEVAKYSSIVPPNTTAQIFWLKNRRKDLWRDVHQLEHGRPGEFEALSDLDLAQRMAESARNLSQLERELGKKEKKS